jgi:hypothetical protein
MGQSMTQEKTINAVSQGMPIFELDNSEYYDSEAKDCFPGLAAGCGLLDGDAGTRK